MSVGAQRLQYCTDLQRNTRIHIYVALKCSMTIGGNQFGRQPPDIVCDISVREGAHGASSRINHFCQTEVHNLRLVQIVHQYIELWFILRNLFVTTRLNETYTGKITMDCIITMQVSKAISNTFQLRR